MRRRSYPSPPPPVRPNGLVRRGCGCLMLCLVLVIIGIVLLTLGGVWLVERAYAAEGAGPQAVALSPAIPLAPPDPRARGVYLEQSYQVEIPLGQVLLASSADGRGDLCSDDRARLTFLGADGQVQHWQHAFADASSGGIRCLPPQDLTPLVTPGRYTVTLSLEDVHPPVYGSQPYYLVLLPHPTPSPADLPVAQTPDHPISLPEPTTSIPMAAWLWIAVLAGSLVTTGMVLAHRRQPRRPRHVWTGIIDVHDPVTGEVCTALLMRYRFGAALLRQPLRLEPLPDCADAAVPDGCVALLLPGVHGPVLQERPNQQSLVRPITLNATDAYALDDDTLVLRYRR